jgi:hypothetical protein
MNLNDIIKVKLTEVGLRIHHKSITDNGVPNKYVQPVVDTEGFFEFQLCEFMSIFGAFVYNGAENIIENNEIILKDSKAILVNKLTERLKVYETGYSMYPNYEERISYEAKVETMQEALYLVNESLNK